MGEAGEIAQPGQPLVSFDGFPQRRVTFLVVPTKLGDRFLVLAQGFAKAERVIRVMLLDDALEAFLGLVPTLAELVAFLRDQRGTIDVTPPGLIADVLPFGR